MLETVAAHLDTVAALAPTWGYLFIFVFMAIESSFIPFPSEVVMVPAGFLAARGELGAGGPAITLLIAIAAGLAGSIAGAFVNYYLALFVGKPFLEKLSRRNPSIAHARSSTSTAPRRRSCAVSCRSYASSSRYRRESPACR